MSVTYARLWVRFRLGYVQIATEFHNKISQYTVSNSSKMDVRFSTVNKKEMRQRKWFRLGKKKSIMADEVSSKREIS